MTFETQGGNEKKSECRALVPVTPQEIAPRNIRFPAAPFVVQLAANAKGYAAYRAKRRAHPAYGARSYRAAVTRTVSARPPGANLNYCA